MQHQGSRKTGSGWSSALTLLSQIHSATDSEGVKAICTWQRRRARASYLFYTSWQTLDGIIRKVFPERQRTMALRSSTQPLKDTRSVLQRAVTAAPASQAQDAPDQAAATVSEPVSRVGRTLEDMLKTP